jgi:hypothetical protein
MDATPDYKRSKRPGFRFMLPPALGSKSETAKSALEENILLCRQIPKSI